MTPTPETPVPKPPKDVRDAAQRGLDLRDEYGRGGTEVGIARGRDLSNGADVSEETIARMRSFFARHGAQHDAGWKTTDDGEPSNGLIAWLLWGGDPGKRWANSDQFTKAEEPTMPRTIPAENAISLGVAITKRDDDRRLVFGFAKFAEDPDARGRLLVDRQDDVVLPDDLADAAYEYVLTSRDAGEMHKSSGAGHLVESFVVTPEKLGQMGLPADALPAGWWVGYHVAEVEKGEPDPWEKIKSGEYAGFSIEGFGVREEVEILDPVEDVTKGYYDLDIDPWSDEGLDSGAFAERRQMILDLRRANRITQAEADALLAMLPPPEEYLALVAEQRARREEEGLLGKVRRALGLDREGDEDDSAEG